MENEKSNLEEKVWKYKEFEGIEYHGNHHSTLDYIRNAIDFINRKRLGPDDFKIVNSFTATYSTLHGPGDVFPSVAVIYREVRD